MDAMHTFQLYQDVPAIECNDSGFLDQPFPHMTQFEDYNRHWRVPSPARIGRALSPSPEVESPHLREMKWRVSSLASYASGHGDPSSIDVRSDGFSHLGIHSPTSQQTHHFRSLRYMSPNGPMGGTLSTDSTSSECSSSPDAIRHASRPYQWSFDGRDADLSPTCDSRTPSTHGDWNPQPLYNYGLVQSPVPASQSISMKDLQYSQDPEYDDHIASEDYVKVEVHGPEELMLSSRATAVYEYPSSTQDPASSQDNNEDSDDDDDDGDDYYEGAQDSDDDPSFNPHAPQRTLSNQVRQQPTTSRRRSPKRTRSTTSTAAAVIGTDARVTKPAQQQRKHSSRRASQLGGNKKTRKDTTGAGAERRDFVCTFHHYGCAAVFASKNEWKRHVASQHLCLGFYRCQTGNCRVDPRGSGSKAPNDFNRKDLFTQHHRRMHTPWGSGAKAPNAKVGQEFEHGLKAVQEQCWHEERTPPQRSTCGFCRRVFVGKGAWEERMEHVGRHYEAIAKGSVQREDLQEEEDEELKEWALQEGIIVESESERGKGGGCWLVGFEPKGTTPSSRRRRVQRPQHDEDDDDEDEDAEGEEL